MKRAEVEVLQAPRAEPRSGSKGVGSASPRPGPQGAVSFEPRIVLRPRSLDESLDLAVAYLRIFRRDFARATLRLVAPIFTALLLLDYEAELGWAELWALTIIASGLVERALIVYAGWHLFGNDPHLGRALLTLLRRPLLALLGPVLGPLPLLPMLLDGLENPGWIGMGAVLGVFWALVLGFHLYFAPVAFLEGLRTPLARRRSSALCERRYARALAFLAVAFGLRVGAVICAEFTSRFVLGAVLQLGDTSPSLLGNGGSWPALLGYMLASPLLSLARLFDYVDARTSLEGWDIQVRFKHLALSAEPPLARRAEA